MKAQAKLKTEKKPEVNIVQSTEQKPKQNKTPINNLYLGIALAIMILIGVGLLAKNQIIIATVNGKPITRFELIADLEKQAGKKTLETIVTETLILQEAEKQNISIAQEEIDQEIQKIEKNVSSQGQNLANILAAQAMTMETLISQIKMQKLVTKLAVKDVSVTDEEINSYIDKNKESLSKTEITDEVRQQIKQSLEDEKSNSQIQAWLKKLQTEAKINYYHTF